ncbi:hypothetical protein D915_001764 [Fasciola hepatica]|uniref:Uncharacterized protein n=1 Tax=Fasciola hepatica TaxID=6192 RepID=A0A4E0RYL1_FASHE|nr:hypothetical protein D915_001764 [Fasciola hepatica]
MRLSTIMSTETTLTYVTSVIESNNETQPELVKNAEDSTFWSHGWQGEVAGSRENDSVIIAGHDSTIFRFHEYAASDPRDAGSSSSGDVVTKQNQMLPIYCSIMGMIIISLLLYVIYKLWKQREAMANAKLSEVFANGTANGLDKALIRSPNVTIGSAAAASPPIGPVLVTVPEATTAIPTEGTYDQMHHHTQSPVSETHSHGRRSGRKVRDPHEVSTNSEKLPLISGAQTSLTDQDYMEKPLNSIPRNTLGFVCYSLAQNGWRDLAIATGLGSDHLDQLDQMKSDKRIQWPIPEDLFQAAQCAKSLESAGGVPPSEQDLMGAVLTVGKLMERPDMNVHTFCTALEKSTRLDLVSMLTKSNCPASNGS